MANRNASNWKENTLQIIEVNVGPPQTRCKLLVVTKTQNFLFFLVVTVKSSEQRKTLSSAIRLNITKSSVAHSVSGITYLEDETVNTRL